MIVNRAEGGTLIRQTERRDAPLQPVLHLRCVYCFNSFLQTVPIVLIVALLLDWIGLDWVALPLFCFRFLSPTRNIGRVTFHIGAFLWSLTRGSLDTGCAHS